MRIAESEQKGRTNWTATEAHKTKHDLQQGHALRPDSAVGQSKEVNMCHQVPLCGDLLPVHCLRADA